MSSVPTCCARDVDAVALEAIFADLFLEHEHTALLGGADEPLYEPATGTSPAVIHYRHDYVASALHEVAHWCIAGKARRNKLDYGYWYSPDGRSGDAQERFQSVESKPQALEWCFSQAAGLPFRISLDNLDTPPEPAVVMAFSAAVVAAGESLRERGLPPRARRFFDRLGREFRTGLEVRDLSFSVKALA